MLLVDVSGHESKNTNQNEGKIMNLKTLVKPLVWLGKEIYNVVDWVPKIVAVIRDSADEAKKIEPKLVTTFQTVESLAKFALADGKVLLPSLKTLFEDLKDLGGAGMVNPANYLQLVNAVNAFIGQVHGLDTTQFVHLVDDLISEYDDLGAEVKATIDKIGADLKADATYQYLGIDSGTKTV